MEQILRISAIWRSICAGFVTSAAGKPLDRYRSLNCSDNRYYEDDELVIAHIFHQSRDYARLVKMRGDRVQSPIPLSFLREMPKKHLRMALKQKSSGAYDRQSTSSMQDWGQWRRR